MSQTALKITKEANNNTFKNCDIDGVEVDGYKNDFIKTRVGPVAITIGEFFIKKMLMGSVNSLADTVEKLGALGTITFSGSLILITLITGVDFNKEFLKTLVFSCLSLFLLIFSGIIYYLRFLKEKEKVETGLEVLKQVYNRLAEQTAKTEKEQTSLIVDTINCLPDKIAEVINKTMIQ